MRARLDPVEALAALPRLEDAAEKRAGWRQAITALGRNVRVTGPPPLDGIAPEQLVRSIQVVLENGLADDLDWIGAGQAAVALYEISTALPAGRERRELGRRVLGRLYEGTAATFAAVATRMALGSGKPLDAPPLRARIGLLLDLPIGVPVNGDALALALVTRNELFQRWVARPAIGALPARRLAAKLLEHAAREAVLRAQQGDSQPLELMSEPGSIHSALGKLLADREPLVWRHAASARGLLAALADTLNEDIDMGLDPSLTPTEWRRAAVSRVASLSVQPSGIKQCRQILTGDLIRSDPGLPATMIWGLPRVIEAEPDAAEEVFDWLSALRRPDVADAAAKLFDDLAVPTFGERGCKLLLPILEQQARDSESALRGIASRDVQALRRTSTDEAGVAFVVRRALHAYEAAGARAAYDLAVRAAASAHATLDLIEVRDPEDEASLASALGMLDELDAAVLERSRLNDLLLLGRRPGDTDIRVPEMERVYDRLGRALLDAEERVLSASWSRTGSVADQRRLIALLHLIDVEASQIEGDDTVRARIARSVAVLLNRLAAGPDAAVHRVLCAALSRSLDAAVREGVFDPGELLLAVADRVGDRHTVDMMSEASTSPDVSGALRAYADFLESPAGRESVDSISDGAFDTLSRDAVGNEQSESTARRVVGLSKACSAGGSYRSEALRQVILRIGRALETISAARGLSELVDSAGSGIDPLGDLEADIDSLRQLTASALRRVFGEDGHATIAVVADVAPLSALVERAVGSGVPANAHQISMAMGELVADVPPTLAHAISRVVARIEGLPVAAASDVFAIPLEKRRSALPDWLLPRRTIGAFYVVRALGSGGGSTVFVARRVEERHKQRAESFALKVPEYDPSTARSISEQEFMQLFREEAGALLALPQHPNLARFVTFDLGARPKPILVMEHIRGVSLDRLIRNRSLTVDRAFAYLDGILAALEAMHAAAIGHLDIKPSNVILRSNDVPVLVDFGLSGRQLRPGCGTPEYCSPEVLGLVPPGHTPLPMPADLYAFACTAFELLCAEPLFEAGDETGLLSLHVSHDGWPEKLARYASDAALSQLCVVLAACLRRDPRQRPTVAETRAALKSVAAPLCRLTWPLGPARQAGLTG